jgi:4a-hydroxytetrahydrobiopterin dehydratase
MASELAQRDLIPPHDEKVPALKGAQLESFLDLLGNQWQVLEEQRLEKEFKFKNFREALDFTNRIGELAESVDHHPEIWLTWGKARITIWTHSIGGLSEADFVFAARADQLYLTLRGVSS